MREDLKRGVFLDGVVEETASSARETLEILRKGARNRHIGATSMNLESSRSHSVFSLYIESKTAEGGVCKVRRSQFHFVDLAGSERQKKTEAKGERLKEGCNINRSLSVLGGVINALVETTQGKKVHVRYRDSKLTFLLRDSLGGNSKTAVIANISQASSAYYETLSTLQFAQRAKMIKNKARLNEDLSGDAEALRIEVRRLKEELESARCIIQSLESRAPLTEDIEDSCKGGVASQQVKELLLQENSRAFELESILKDLLESLSKTQAMLDYETSRKQSTIHSLGRILRMSHSNEMHLRLALALTQERFERHCERAILDENLLKERDHFRSVALSLPTASSLFHENLILQERLQSLDPVILHTRPSTSSILALLQALSLTLDDSLASRTKLKRVLSINAQEEQLISLEQTVSSLTQQSRWDQITIRDLQEKLTEAQRAAQDSRTQLQIKENEIHLIKKQLEVASSPSKTEEDGLSSRQVVELERQIASLEAQLLSVQALAQAERSALEKERAEVTKLIQAESALAMEKSELQLKLHKQRGEMEGWAKERSTIQKQVQALLLENQKIRKASIDEAEMRKRAEQQLSAQVIYRISPEVEAEIESLRSELLQSEEEKDTIANSLDFFRGEFENQSKKKDAKIKELQNTISMLERAQANKHTNSNQPYLIPSPALAEEITALKDRILEAENEIHTKNQTILSMGTIIDELRSTVSALTSSSSLSRDELSRVSSELMDMQSLQTTLQCENRDMGEKISVLGKEIGHLKAELKLANANLETERSEAALWRARATEREEDRSRLIEESVKSKTSMQLLEVDNNDKAKRIAALTDRVEEMKARANTAMKERNKALQLSNILHNGVVEMGREFDPETSPFWEDLITTCKVKEENRLLRHAVAAKDTQLKHLTQEIDGIQQSIKQDLDLTLKDCLQLLSDNAKPSLISKSSQQKVPPHPKQSKGKLSVENPDPLKENRDLLDAQKAQASDLASLIGSIAQPTRLQPRALFRENLNAANVAVNLASAEKRLPSSDTEGSNILSLVTLYLTDEEKRNELRTLLLKKTETGPIEESNRIVSQLLEAANLGKRVLPLHDEDAKRSCYDEFEQGKRLKRAESDL